MKIRKLFIANRGEIACRIMRTCQRLGIEVVVGYSDADVEARHVRLAPQAARLGPAPSAQSYLNQEAIVAAALRLGCDAVHPGYGFLSENAEFAARVETAGLVFVGPRPDTIEQMGDKSRAKAAMIAADVATVPGGAEASEDPALIAEWIDEVGFPVMLKPAAGGGGKGMVVLDEPPKGDEIASAIRTARASFGNGALLVERLIRSPRHVEVQVFGDGNGNAVHLFDRECSLQRRHQKVIEEAPASHVQQAIRDEMIDAAVRGTRALNYRNAGTFEFIVDDSGYYFLEVNTRLQVEHPVTEEITGLDLVEWQLRIASGEGLPLAQGDINCTGHAIEARVYAEDPLDGFRPSSGRVTAALWDSAARCDLGVEAGDYVSPFYDPMIAKLIVRGADRQEALSNMRKAVDHSAVFGIATNLGFVKRLCSHPTVVAGQADTRFIDRAEDLMPAADAPAGAAFAAAAVAELRARNAPRGETCSPWDRAGSQLILDRKTLDPEAPLGRVALYHEGSRKLAKLIELQDGWATVSVSDDRANNFSFDAEGAVISGESAGQVWHAHSERNGVDLSFDGQRLWFSTLPATENADQSPTCKSPLPGVVTALPVSVGDKVAYGDMLAVVEAMKMENAIVAPLSGTVAEVCCAVDQQVVAGQVLVEITPDPGY
ncbi:biotin carboxylase N-terminal domain-containing protein [uncultured Roseovarius sp.]|uniref:acetyl/propionyl/methylcrotonyl-CoA carboxylase subunit alpha n=1 Tax=uncultured Roseovarius sp. TaxID=293344 RepID=UPI0026054C73|nr:biotin carboxylase N-terminal domain-containing protein [uncultured Roseovarius sp.]